MGGTDTNRGINYQNARAILTALEVLADPNLKGFRIEGTEDIYDIEVFDSADILVRGQQIKARDHAYTWSAAEIHAVVLKWAALGASGTEFQFITDGRLGPSALKFRQLLGETTLTPEALDEVLGYVPTQEETNLLGQVNIVEDPGGTEEALRIATADIKSQITLPLTPVDQEAAANNSVNSLFRGIATAAAEKDPSARYFDKLRIRSLLFDLTPIPARDRWDSSLRAEYVSYASELTTAGHARLTLLEYRDSGTTTKISLENVIDGGATTIVSGLPGTGKSSLSVMLMKASADVGVACILARAEEYLPGNLRGLIAGSLSQALGRNISLATAMQCLGDPTTTIIIDGASEIPYDAQRALRLELAPLCAGGSLANARCILVGRSEPALAALIPSAVRPRRITTTKLSQAEQIAIAKICLVEEYALPADDTSQLVQIVIEHLESAAENPQIFTIAIQAAAKGVVLSCAVDALQYSIREICRRAHVANSDQFLLVLGTAFCLTLDSSKRHVRPTELKPLLAKASAICADRIFISVDEVLESALRSGLLVASGQSETLVPAHDSLADVLSARALAAGVMSLPDQLKPSDLSRLSFLGQMRSLDPPTVGKIASDIPFGLVNLAKYDTVHLSDEEASEHLTNLLNILTPSVEGSAAQVRAISAGYDVTVKDQSALPAKSLEHYSGASTRIVATRDMLCAEAATKLWRIKIRKMLAHTARPIVAVPEDVDAVATLLRGHYEERRRVIEDLITRVTTLTSRPQLEQAVGQTGAHVALWRVSDEADYAYRVGPQILCQVLPEPSVEVRVTGEEPSLSGEQWWVSSGPVAAILDEGPLADATKVVKKSIESLTENSWLM